MVKYFTMEGVSLEELVLKVLKSSKRPLSFEEILGRLGLDKKERKALKKVLRSLRRSGKVGVVFGCKAKVAKVMGRIMGPLHGP